MPYKNPAEHPRLNIRVHPTLTKKIIRLAKQTLLSQNRVVELLLQAQLENLSTREDVRDFFKLKFVPWN